MMKRQEEYVRGLIESSLCLWERVLSFLVHRRSSDSENLSTHLKPHCLWNPRLFYFWSISTGRYLGAPLPQGWREPEGALGTSLDSMAGEAGVFYWAMPRWPCFLLKHLLSHTDMHPHFPPHYAENLKCQLQQGILSLSLYRCRMTWRGSVPAQCHQDSGLKTGRPRTRTTRVGSSLISGRGQASVGTAGRSRTQGPTSRAVPGVT